MTPTPTSPPSATSPGAEESPDARNGKPRKKGAARSWTPEEDRLLRKLVGESPDPKAPDYEAIARHFEQRSDANVMHRWMRVLNPELVKGPWTPEVRFAPPPSGAAASHAPSPPPPTARRRTPVYWSS